MERELVTRFAIPGRVPSVNGRWRQGKHGQVYKDPATREFETRFATYALAARPATWSQCGTYRLDLTVIGSNADIDNITKCCGDAGEGILWNNDRQIWSLNVHLIRTKLPHPMLLVRVTPR